MPKEFANTQDLVAIEEIRDDTVVLKNGSLRQILMVGGVNFSLKSEEEQVIITQGYQNFLNALDFPIQIVIHSRKINIDRYLAGLEARRVEEPSALLQNQIAEYQEFIRGFVTENAIMAKTFFVVVPFSPIVLPSKEAVSKFIPFFKKKNHEAEKRALEAKQMSFREALGQLKQRVTQVAQGLAAIGLETKVLTTEELIELFYNFYNPETVEKEKLNLPEFAENAKS